jgi:hypothetical protein
MATEISPEVLAQRFFEQVESDEVRIKDAQQFTVRADDLKIVDPTDVTKVLQFDLSGFTTATTRTITAPDANMTVGGVGSKRTVVDTGGVYATPIVLTAADSGKIILLDDAAGLDFTLPAIAAADVGIQYTFFITTQVTSNAYRITAQSGDLFRGHVLISDFDAAYTAPQILTAEADESNDVIMTMALIASGGGKGGWFELTAIHATGWFVRGLLIGDGTIVTVFS